MHWRNKILFKALFGAVNVRRNKLLYRDHSNRKYGESTKKHGEN
jgi:hypothetical protein